MTVQTAILLTLLKTFNLLLGGLITFFAYRAYRRTESSALLLLALGFGIITVGAATAGIVDQFLSFHSNTALLVESLFTTAGFGAILYSLYR